MTQETIEETQAGAQETATEDTASVTEAPDVGAPDTVTEAPEDDAPNTAVTKEPATTEPDAKPTAADDGFDDELMAMADHYGFGAEGIRQFGNAENARAALAALDRKAVQLLERQRNGKVPTAEPVAPKQEPKPEPKPQPAPSLNLDDLDLDDETIAEIKKRISPIEAERDAIKAEREKAEADAREQMAHQEEVNRWRATDAMVATAREISPEWSEVFGEQQLNEMREATKFDQNWHTFKSFAQRIAEAAQEGYGAPLGNDRRKFVERVLRAAFPDEANRIHNKRIAAKAKEQSQKHTTKPTTREGVGKALSEDEQTAKARQVAAEGMRALGMDPDPFDMG